jgi:hypothetical protein
MPPKTLILNDSAPHAERRIFTLGSHSAAPRHFLFGSDWRVLVAPMGPKPAERSVPAKKN